MTFKEYVKSKNDVSSEDVEPFCPFKLGGYCNDAYNDDECCNCEWAQSDYEECGDYPWANDELPSKWELDIDKIQNKC